jgi:hypothetical protein
MLHRNFLLKADMLLVSYHKNTHKRKANNPEQAPKDEANHCGPHCKSDLFPHLEPHISPLLQHEVECAAISKEALVQPGAVLTDERVTLSYQLPLLPASAPLL